MAFAGLLVGWLAIGSVSAVVGVGPWTLAAASLMTAAGALFYAKVGPLWAQATRDEPEAPPVVAQVLGSPISWPATLAWVVLGVVVALGGSIALGLLVEVLGVPVQEQATVLDITETARSGGVDPRAVVLAFSALLLAPIAEEWLFRRLLFVRIAARAGRPIAYALSALAFALIHGNPVGLIIYTWLGLVFAFVLERTGRLPAAIAVHMGNNAYVLAVLFWGG